MIERSHAHPLTSSPRLCLVDVGVFDTVGTVLLQQAAETELDELDVRFYHCTQRWGWVHKDDIDMECTMCHDGPVRGPHGTLCTICKDYQNFYEDRDAYEKSQEAIPS